MSYDLMVFDPSAAPRDPKAFLAWYDEQTEWTEGHGYHDPSVTSPALRAFFLEMIQTFPALNGPYANDEHDDPRSTDYAVGKHVIYAAFSWSQMEPAFRAMVALARRHDVGFFDVSDTDGAIVFPGEYDRFSKFTAADAR